MIDPTNITKFDCSDFELEETLLFWICAAGKNAIVASSSLNKLLFDICKNKYTPFEAIKKTGQGELSVLLKKFGIGCYNNKSRSFWELANSNLNLRTCSHEDLENIYGIGMKTSRCFIIHSRKNARCAGLDVHILKFMNKMGYDVPKTTPNKKDYVVIENQFLELIKHTNKPIAEIDLLIWNHFSGHKDVKKEALDFFRSLKSNSLCSID